MGKILIQTNAESKEPELIYTRLPRSIQDCHVFIMDAVVATGSLHRNPAYRNPLKVRRR